MILQQSEHPISTRNYSFDSQNNITVNFTLSASMDPASTAKQHNLNPQEKSKISAKYKHVFNQQPTSFHTPITKILVHSCFEIMEFIEFLMNSTYWL